MVNCKQNSQIRLEIVLYMQLYNIHLFLKSAPLSHEFLFFQALPADTHCPTLVRVISLL